MKIYKKIIEKSKYAILLLVCFLLLLNVRPVEASEVEDVDENARCSILINVPKAFQEELKDKSIPVRLYRIADVTETGAYEDIEGYESLKLSQLSIKATAKQLEEKAAQVVELLKVDVGNGDTVAKPYREFYIEDNRGIVTDLETGLYLLYVEDYVSGTDRYNALPYIIFLPGAFEWQNSDGKMVREWSYDLVAELKLGAGGSDNDSSDEYPPPDNPEGEKTGDTANVLWLYTIAIFFGLVFIVVFLSRKHNRVTE